MPASRARATSSIFDGEQRQRPRERRRSPPQRCEAAPRAGEGFGGRLPAAQASRQWGSSQGRSRLPPHGVHVCVDRDALQLAAMRLLPQPLPKRVRVRTFDGRPWPSAVIDRLRWLRLRLTLRLLLSRQRTTTTNPLTASSTARSRSPQPRRDRALLPFLLPATGDNRRLAGGFDSCPAHQKAASDAGTRIPPWVGQAGEAVKVRILPLVLPSDLVSLRGWGAWQAPRRSDRRPGP